MRIRTRDRALTYVLLAVSACFAGAPIVATLVQSVHPDRGPALTVASYITAWADGGFASALVSSAVIASTVVVVSIVLACLAAFALTVFVVPGRRVILALLLVGLVLPYEVTVLPLYQQLSQLGLVDTWGALILPQIGLSMPLSIFWMRGFFDSIPADVRAAGQIDGASPLQILRLIMIPIASPAIATLGVLLFLFTWNEFLLALVLIPTNQAAQTAPLALSAFSGAQHSADPSVTAAAAVLVALPVVIVYVVLQRRIISGIVDGAVK